jgi:hypothetical protein
MLNQFRQPVYLGVRHPSESHVYVFIAVRQLRACYVGHPLWWEDGCIVYNCCLSSLAVILGFEPLRAHDYILLSQISESPNLKGKFHIFISPRSRLVQLYPRHWVSSSHSFSLQSVYLNSQLPKLSSWCLLCNLGQMQSDHCYQQYVHCDVMCSLSFKLLSLPLPSSGWRLLLNFAVIMLQGVYFECIQTYNHLYHTCIKNYN